MQKTPTEREDQIVFDAYLWSDNEKDIEYAHALCEAAGLDYATERARVTAERLAAARKRWTELKAAVSQPKEAML